MPCNSNNCDSFSSAIGAFQALKEKHAPSYVIGAGDFNVDLSRLQLFFILLLSYTKGIKLYT